MTRTNEPGRANAGRFLPMTRAEMDQLGWSAPDILLITGDAYVDHPSFGAALLGRWLAASGFRVAIVAQPRWDNSDDIARLGRPGLFAGVTAGALDSMLAHYTAFRKKRHDDAYTPGGEAGKRPNRACTVYTSLVRHAFPGLPVVIGGIEASMRRATHYDFWTDAMRRSILFDSKADLLVYGMAERSILEVARRLRASGLDSAGADRRAAKKLLEGIPGTVYVADGVPAGVESRQLPSHEEIVSDPGKLMTATLILEQQAHNGTPWLTQAHLERTLVIAPPATPLASKELDELYALPFTRMAHPSYAKAPPAVEMIQFSVASHRGCASGCSFCALALHQGRNISSRSRESILSEIKSMTSHPAWRGSITNIGGATVNMWGASCAANPAVCHRTSCLWPDICRSFQADQKGLADLMRAARRIPGVKHVRTAGGIRHDLALTDRNYMEALVGEFTGGQLTVAPEHKSDKLLALMRKPPFAVFEQFLGEFEQLSRRCGKEQYVIPYLMSAFPGCTDADMRELTAWLKQRGWRPQQVQCFIPTPGTVATAMYCAAIDPSGRPLHVARTDAERLRQHGILSGTSTAERGR
ncbi:MAG: YgiQ family radical SAM protein [bacterium]